MTRLVAETWIKMPQSVRSNLINLLSELIATRDASVEVLMLHVFRRMSSEACFFLIEAARWRSKHAEYLAHRVYGRTDREEQV